MSASVVTLVAVGSILVYGYVAYTTRAAAHAVRGSSIAHSGLFERWIPALIFVPYVVIAARPGPEIRVPDELRILGLALIVGGVLLAIWAARTLGRHFDLDVEVHSGHQVVRGGPYAFVRHPIYAGLSLHLVGACLATGNVVLLAGTLLGAIPAFVLRARAEERVLRENLGAPYERYAREVPMLVPFPRTIASSRR